MPPCCGLKAMLLTLLGQPRSHRDLFNPTDLKFPQRGCPSYLGNLSALSGGPVKRFADESLLLLFI